MLSSNTSAVSGDTKYIEDYFSSYLYTGNGTSQTITNGVDLATKGGFVWIKDRTTALDHHLFDTARGADYTLRSNTTDPQYSQPGRLSTFNTNGFSIGNGNAYTNGSGDNYVSWSFAKATKFFDVVTFTAGTSTNQRISHSLGSTPGCIIVKRTDSISNWITYHRSLTNPITNNVWLDTTDAQYSGLTNQWGTSLPTSTDFGMNATYLANGGSYVAYIFAHDAGGFGLTGTDNVISCGSYTCDGSGNFSVNLGYEPQWIMYKRTDSASSGGWYMVDNMRGLPVVANSTSFLLANSTAAENTLGNTQPTATGFSGGFVAGATCIYIAIRRGPMKVPTEGTKVFAPALTTNDSSPITSGFPVDSFIFGKRDVSFLGYTEDRLRGSGNTLRTNTTGAESASGVTGTFASNTSITPNLYGATTSMIAWMFQRAPSFFDEVCYTGVGNGTAQTVPHNLAAVPEMMILKKRSSTASWPVYHKDLGNTSLVYLDLDNAVFGPGYGHFGSTTPTASNFYLQGSNEANESGATFVAYLFATCPGVSKVGSYTGTGTTKQVDCGFTSGARFVLIKKTSGTGSWYVWDTARGIVSGNDPYLLLNSTAAEVTSTDYIDAYSAGFELSSSAPGELNASGGSYIFLAVA